MLKHQCEQNPTIQIQQKYQYNQYSPKATIQQIARAYKPNKNTSSKECNVDEYSTGQLCRQQQS